MSQALLKMKGMQKRFKANVALGGVDLEVKPGEVHVLLGENGAGKSTLMKILTGYYQPDEGQIEWEGQPVTISSPAVSLDLGIAMVYQELTLVKEMSVIENVYLGKLPKRKLFPLVHWNKAINDTKDLMDRLGLSSIDIHAPISRCELGTRQLVEIVRAISKNAKLIILDEPTSALTELEVQKLFNAIAYLKEQGVSFIYITHKLKEVFEIGDRVTVLRDGKTIGTIQSLADTSEDELIRMMVGRSLDEKFPKETHLTNEVLMQVSNLTDSEGSIRDISFTLHKGEVLGIAGLEGSGRTEMVETIFGLRKAKSGEIRLFGDKPYVPSDPRDAISRKIAYLTKDRKKSLLLHMPIFTNVTVSSSDGFSVLGFRKKRNELEVAGEFLQKLKVNTKDPHKTVNQLSGGNQQKIAIARWLCSKSEIFIMDEPTRGIDVGAKVEVYKLMNDLTKEGAGIILISSEMPELLGMSDRILVMKEGKIVSDMDIHESSQELIMQKAAGGI